MRKNPRPIVHRALIISLALMLSACGGSDNADSPLANQASVSETAAGTSNATSGSGAAGSTDSTAAIDTSDSSGSSGDSSSAPAGGDTSQTVETTEAQQTSDEPEARVLTVSNTPPAIWGNPLTELQTGDVFLFIPGAQDQDGDPLSFSIMNQPSWTTFDPESGILQGVPAAADIGQSVDVRIFVHDGLSTTGLPAFTISVVEGEAQNGSVVLNWLPPTENEDGTALTDLSAYRIYYGPAPDQLDDVIVISNPGVSSYVVENLALTTWYFAASAVNSQGVESEPSSVIEMTAI